MLRCLIILCLLSKNHSFAHSAVNNNSSNDFKYLYFYSKNKVILKTLLQTKLKAFKCQFLTSLFHLNKNIRSTVYRKLLNLQLFWNSFSLYLHKNFKKVLKLRKRYCSFKITWMRNKKNFVYTGNPGKINRRKDRNQTRLDSTKNFNLCFCVTFGCCNQNFISRRKCGH